MHSVTLERDKCMGCINCMKRCPTEAIRVRDGKAHIIEERCIDCGECIRICHHHAKRSVYDEFEIINNYKYKIALPAPSLYGQFNNLPDIAYVLTGLKMIGFDDVYEVSRSAEVISDLTRLSLIHIFSDIFIIYSIYSYIRLFTFLYIFLHKTKKSTDNIY